MKLILWIARILFGAVFIFSGFVKAIDPLGSAYKFQDYFLSFDAPWAIPMALPLSVILSGFEFLVGVAILLGLKMRYSAWGGLLFMVFFTPLTLYIALYDPVSDCGCFGDAIIISNWGTFYKNIVFLLAAIILVVYRHKVKPLWSEKKDWLLVGVAAVSIVAMSVYCLRHLPIIDFRPWKIGNNIRELLTPTPEVADTYLIFENQETGELREYPANNYPWDDSEWAALWKYKDMRLEVISPFVEAPITNFYIEDEFGQDIRDEFIYNSDYQFLVIAYDLDRAHVKSFDRRVTPLAEEAEKHGYSFIVLTSSVDATVEAFRHARQTPYPFYRTDEVALKTIVRSNPGLVLLKDGVVVGKWAHRDIPRFDQLDLSH